jgi:tryptophan halogenase
MNAPREQRPVRRVVILGGGTAGWMAAAALAKALGGRTAVHVVESEAIGTIGVGESTIPMIRRYLAALEIDEDDFMRATGATFKLGIEFRDWHRVGARYMHGFGRFGHNLDTLPFHQHWLRLRQAGRDGELAHYSINQMAARAGRCLRADAAMANSPLADIVHAFHLDASQFARYLRGYSEGLGVTRTEGRVVDVRLHGDTGHVSTLRLDDGTDIAGDLFIDCSGQRALLIGDAMGVGFEDWGHWLPCDRAWAVPCARAGELLPYTVAAARPAGWQWRIGLRDRTGNGHVYASAFMDDDTARRLLLEQLDGEPLDAPRLLAFRAGRRARAWERNVVAIGLSSGFLEPLESTSIHMIQTAIARLLDFFPDAAFRTEDIDQYNLLAKREAEHVRDFLILHYHATERRDTPFWDHVRTMTVPETLRERIALYLSRGRTVRMEAELFAEVGWMQVMEGQGLAAGGYHPLADVPALHETAASLDAVASVIQRCVEVMPTHAALIAAINEGH